MSDTNEKITLELNGKSYPVSLPDYEIAMELTVASTQNAYRASGAVLGVCCHGLTDKRYENHGYNAMSYGTAVWRELRAAGVSEAQMVSAATPLIERIAKSLMPAGVDERVGFTSPSEGG